MRSLMLVSILCGSAFAQQPSGSGPKHSNQPPIPRFFLYNPESGTQPDSQKGGRSFDVNPEIWKKFLEKQQRPNGMSQPNVDSGKLALRPNQPCAVPLTNVLKPSAQPEPMIIPTPSPDGFPIRQVPLPAPSCDDVKK